MIKVTTIYLGLSASMRPGSAPINQAWITISTDVTCVQIPCFKLASAAFWLDMVILYLTFCLPTVIEEE